MIAQRGGAPFAAPSGGKPGRAEREASRMKPAGSGGPKTKRRLSFNEKHALETLPGKIAALEKEVAELQKRLNDPTLYARDRQTFEEVSAALVRAQAELAGAEHRWLELEILREEIGSL
jgi:ATP-binding cassette subfamily F protein uup